MLHDIKKISIEPIQKEKRKKSRFTSEYYYVSGIKIEFEEGPDLDISIFSNLEDGLVLKEGK